LGGVWKNPFPHTKTDVSYGARLVNNRNLFYRLHHPFFYCLTNKDKSRAAATYLVVERARWKDVRRLLI